MIILGGDTETTGLLEDEHRFTEIYLSLHDESGKKLFEFEQRIDPQRSITAEAQRITGITGTMLVGCPTWETVAPKVKAILERADVWVFHNAGFDTEFLRKEFKRVGSALPERHVVDTMEDGIWASPTGKKPSLSELCFACGVDYDPSKAHAAAYDVDVMMESFFNARRWGYFELPQDREVQQAA